MRDDSVEVRNSLKEKNQCPSNTTVHLNFATTLQE